ncbi:hypothetical protein DXG01_002286 [Tephrocybe rancida]|nr:hypothetical protein DXG01_002286 [Tephrocybe rancida]
MEPTASDGKKPSAVKRLLGRLGVSKPTKSSLISSTAATQSVENVTGPASATQPAANVLGKPAHHIFTVAHQWHPDVVTAPAAPQAAASVQLVTGTHASFSPWLVKYSVSLTFYKDMDTTLATNIDQGGSMPPVAVGSVSLSNLNQPALPGLNVPRVQNKLKGMDVALDGFLTALRVAKDSSDWNPFLKAALSSIMAIIDLAKTVSDNLQDMKDTLVRIQGLLPILETSAKRLEGRKDGFGKGNNLMTFAITMQAELEKIQQMQSHGLFRHVLQGPHDAGTLLRVYKHISEALEEFKPDGEPVYWLTGPAGIGKTTIAKTICKLVDDREKGENANCVLFLLSPA